MYEAMLGLTHKPFGLTPDQRQYVALAGHEHCARLLPNAIEQGDGFLLVTGEVGTGKTLLCHQLVATLRQNEQWKIVWLTNPMLSRQGLLAAICRELGIGVRNHSSSQLLDALAHTMRTITEAGEYLVLIIDEAQALETDTLEVLRLLTNLEHQTRKMAHVVLFAQPEIESRLAQRQYRQIRQRIVWHHRLAPLRGEEVKRYVDQRLQAAGYIGPPLFSRIAIHQIARQSRGIPRLINLLADKALLAMQANHDSKVGRRHVIAAIRATTLFKTRSLSNYKWWLLLALSSASIAGGVLWLT